MNPFRDSWDSREASSPAPWILVKEIGCDARLWAMFEESERILAIIGRGLFVDLIFGGFLQRFFQRISRHW